ncbi:MAG TPA: FkbM family methyltransferase [Gammaproteobacteria bacterium]|nr:FkbM family methyltransferase [Gammaproteobacteria bacterium]
MKFSELKKWLRSGSWDFVVNSRTGVYSKNYGSFNWKNNTLYFRPGTADTGAIYEILIRPSKPQRANRIFFKQKKLEYWVPEEINPSVILDIGGNIGTTSVYFSNRFPRAKIYTFEPVVDNYKLLEKNATNSPNISTFNVGLGDHDGEIDIYECNEEGNTGGFSIYELDVDKSKKQTIILKNANKILADNNITQVDLIKIDTEGAEYDILTTIDKNTIAKTKWICGELHGHKDFELLGYLSEWFDIGINKKLYNRLSFFHARNKLYADSIPWRG